MSLRAIDLGGGLDLEATCRALLRIEAGDRLVRYPAPVFDGDRMIGTSYLRP